MWEQFWLANTAQYQLYIIVGTIVLVYFLKDILSKLFAALILGAARKIGLKINKQSFFEFLVLPLQKLVFWLVVIIALHKLYLPPGVKDFSIVGSITLGKIIHFIAACIFIFFVCKLIMSVVDYTANILERKANATKDQSDNQLIVFFKDFVKVIIVIMGVLAVIRLGLNKDIGNLLTGLSIVGAAIALATKESLENLIASFVIFFDKPFTTGDEVKVQNITGVVERIGLRSTRIRSGDKTYVSVPNKMMVDSIIDNQSQRTKRKANLSIELAANTPQEAIVQFKTEATAFFNNLTEVKEQRIFFSDFAKNALLLKIELFVSADMDFDDFLVIKEKANLQVLLLLQKNGIAIANNSI